MFNAIIMPIAKVLGYIFNLLFEALSFLHIGNVAVAIVLFTIIVKLCMLPLSIKQQKLTKLNAVMSPEIKAINAKYKDKRNDQNAMMKMQEETKAVYEKYGVSQMWMRTDAYTDAYPFGIIPGIQIYPSLYFTVKELIYSIS